MIASSALPLVESLYPAVDPVYGFACNDLVPDDWQKRFARERPQRALVLCHRQSGKRLWIETELPTPDGWVRMADVKVGDQLFDENGRPCAVTWVGEIAHGDAYRVTFSDGESIVADAEHLWTTLDDKWRADQGRLGGGIPETWATDRRRAGQGRAAGHHSAREMNASTLTTIEIRDTLTNSSSRPGHFAATHSIPCALPLQTPETDLPIDPYTLGAWLGDGTSSSPNITGMDREVFDTIFENGSTVEYRHTTGQGRASTYRICALGVARRGAAYPLRKLNVWNNKHIPPAYLRAGFSQRLELLRGLMDTDGTVTGHEAASRCEFTVTNERLARDVHELIVSLGMTARTTESDAKINGRIVGRRWRIFFTPRFFVFRIARKAARLRFDNRKGSRTKMRFVRSVESVPSVPMRCIRVDSPSHLYLAGRGMIPTHNSTSAALIAVVEAIARPPALILMLSKSQRQASELLRKARLFARPFEDEYPIVGDAATSLVWEAGSRILSLPSNPDTSVGYSAASLIIFDEAGLMPDALYAYVRPIVAVSGGRIVALGTPRGARGWFWGEFCKNGSVSQEDALSLKDGWARYVTDVYKNSRIDPEFLEEERASKTADYYAQEWECRFIQAELSADAPMDPAAVEEAFIPTGKKALF